jgi:hypothetical protein
VTSFQYLIDGTPQYSYKEVGSEAVGIISHDNNDRFVWFKDRGKECMTIDIFHQYLSSDYDLYRLIDNVPIYMSVEEEVKHTIENGSPMKGGIRGAMEVMETTLNEGFFCSDGVMAWTEGLFRHIALDISGVSSVKGRKKHLLLDRVVLCIVHRSLVDRYVMICL